MWWSAKHWPGSLRAVRTDCPLACSEYVNFITQSFSVLYTHWTVLGSSVSKRRRRIKRGLEFNRTDVQTAATKWEKHKVKSQEHNLITLKLFLDRALHSLTRTQMNEERLNVIIIKIPYRLGSLSLPHSPSTLEALSLKELDVSGMHMWTPLRTSADWKSREMLWSLLLQLTVTWNGLKEFTSILNVSLQHLRDGVQHHIAQQ